MNPTKAEDPIGLVMGRDSWGDPVALETELRGTWYRVFPDTIHQVRFLQQLKKGTQVCAPAAGKGSGMFIHCSVVRDWPNSRKNAPLGHSEAFRAVRVVWRDMSPENTAEAVRRHSEAIMWNGAGA